MRSKIRSALLVVMTLTAASSLLPTAAEAQSQHDAGGHSGTSAECSMSFPSYFSGGLSTTPNSGRFDSAGETGTIDCVGKIGGHTVTGPGSFGFEGTLTDSGCLSHKGSGISYFTVPTDAGPVHVSGGGFTVTGVGVFGGVDATHPGVRFVGSYLLVPINGNCVTEPLTEARVLMNGSLRDMPGASSVFKCDLDAGVVKVNCRSGS